MEKLKAPQRAHSLGEAGGVVEAERLRRQARLAVEQELPALLQALPAGGRLVDLGCGSGLLCDAVAAARPDCRVLGVDPDPLAVAEARRCFDRPNLAFELRAVEDGPQHEGQTGDLAVLRLVLMHLPDPVQGLRRCAAWLRGAGCLHVFEADDRALAFSPEPQGMPELLDLMERAQALRGGSRRLGRDLGSLLGQAGYRPLGQGSFAPPEDAAAAAMPMVFAPVARFYLDWSLAQGLLDAAGHRRLAAILDIDALRRCRSAHLPLFHAWGRSETRLGA